MKIAFFIALNTIFCCQAVADNPVDKLNRKYQTMEHEGLLKLRERHIAELKEVKKAAMAAADLTLATQAEDELKALQIEVIQLTEKLKKIQEGSSPMPENEFYKMTFHSGKTGTEKGAKIFANFERLPLTDFAGEKLFLVITANNSKDSETSHEIFVFDEAAGKEVGKVSALARGKTKKIPLLLPPSNFLKLSIAVKGGDALHVKQFEKGVPDLYLEIKK